MTDVRVGLSAMPEAAFAAATAELFADGLVDHLEWSFDIGWGPAGTPPWLDPILDEYADAGRLDGHGVSYSLLSRHPRQAAWRGALADELRRRPYRRVSEHLGFLAAGPFRRGSPLPLPHHPAVLDVGREQVARLSELVGAPIGLENLATSLTEADATEQGALLDDLLAEVDGWQVVDLHNLWCQAANFALDPATVLDRYSPRRVRELHVSGGSWWRAPGSGRAIRRDTHDGPVPAEVHALLAVALRRFPLVDAVVVERLGHTFDDAPDGPANVAFRASYRSIRDACAATRAEATP